MAKLEKHIQITNIRVTNKIQFKNVPINIRLRLNNNKIREHFKSRSPGPKHRDHDIDDNEDRE